MSKLWTFGDSLTAGFKSNDNWSVNYCEWKGYTPKTFNEIISEKLGYELINLGKGGSDNYTIFHTFISSLSQIQKDDIVIIGWTDISRFRLVDDNGGWRTFIANFQNDKSKFRFITDQTIKEILVNRKAIQYYDEINNYIDLINHFNKDWKFLSWSTYNNGMIKGLYINDSEMILQETKGQINDAHFSEFGHINLANKIMDYLQL